MTGPEHYRAAERQIAEVDQGAADWEPLAASARVHGLLALAAATALGGIVLTLPEGTRLAAGWTAAIGADEDGKSEYRHLPF